jgi:hypothetical protein
MATISSVAAIRAGSVADFHGGGSGGSMSALQIQILFSYFVLQHKLKPNPPSKPPSGGPSCGSPK